MKIVVALVAGLLSSTAFADFDTEFASFNKDFERLGQMTAVKKKPKPVVASVSSSPTGTVLSDEPVKETVKESKEPVYITRGAIKDEPVSNEVDPTDPERLGYQLEDPAMREKVSNLYKKPNIKVLSYVLQAE